MADKGQDSMMVTMAIILLSILIIIAITIHSLGKPV